MRKAFYTTVGIALFGLICLLDWAMKPLKVTPPEPELGCWPAMQDCRVEYKA